MDFFPFVLFWIINQYALADQKCPTRFINIPTQRFFNEKLFAGTWYTQLHTTYIWGGQEWVSGIQDIQQVEIGIYNLTFTAFSKSEMKCKSTYSPRMMMVRRSGSYYYNRGLSEVHMLVVSTNYEYALVSLCFGELQRGTCPRYLTKHSILSRTVDFPPDRIIQQMKRTAESTLCVNFTDFQENEQGLCEFENHDEDRLNAEENRPPVKPSRLLTQTGSSTVDVTWNPPNDANVVVRGYRLGIGVTFDNIVTTDVGNDVFRTTFDNLTPETDYLVKISAYNNFGEGKAIYKRVRTKKDPCEFDEIPAQENFSTQKFLGTWYVTSQTTYMWGDNSWESPVIRIYADDSGQLHFVHSALNEQGCTHVESYKLLEPESGVFQFAKGETFAARYKVVFTDYDHALVTVCFSDSVPCEKSKRQVETWTKRTNVSVPEDVGTRVGNMVSGKMCIPTADFVQYDPGTCDVIDDHEEKCDHDHIVSMFITDRDLLMGMWFTRFQTPYQYRKRTWLAKSREYTQVNDSLVEDHHGTMDGSCLHFFKGVVSHPANNPGWFTVGNIYFYGIIPTPVDNYTVLYMCREHNVTHQCNQSKLHVEVMSRDTDVMSSNTRKIILDFISDTFCIPLEALIEEKSPGTCSHSETGQSSCEKRLTVAANYDPQKFAGTWYTRFTTTHMYHWRRVRVLRLKRTYSIDVNRTLHLILAGQADVRCLFQDDMRYIEAGHGAYILPKDPGQFQPDDGYFKVLYIDERYAIVYFCFSGDVGQPCDTIQEQVEVVSRDQAPIPYAVKRKLYWILKTNLCFGLDEMEKLDQVDCQTRGQPYYGVTNQTKSGRVCQRWDAEVPHHHHYWDQPLALENYCRTYDSSIPWCYTNDPDLRWEACSVPICDDDCQTDVNNPEGIRELSADDYNTTIPEIVRNETTAAGDVTIDVTPQNPLVSQTGMTGHGDEETDISQLPYKNRCPVAVSNMHVVEGMHLNKLSGRWMVMKTNLDSFESATITFSKSDVNHLQMTLIHDVSGVCIQNSSSIIHPKCSSDRGDFFISTKVKTLTQWTTFKVLFLSDETAVIYQCLREELGSTCQDAGVVVFVLSRHRTMGLGDEQPVEQALQEACIDPASLRNSTGLCWDELAFLPLLLKTHSLSSDCSVEKIPQIKVDFGKIQGVWYEHLASVTPIPLQSVILKYTQLTTNTHKLVFSGTMTNGSCTEPTELQIVDDCTCCPQVSYHGRMVDPNLWTLGPWKVLHYDGRFLVAYTCIDSQPDGSCSPFGQKVHILSREKTAQDAEIARLHDVIRSACIDPMRLIRISHTGDCSHKVNADSSVNLPSPVANIRVMNLTTNTIQIQWDPPRIGEVTKYIVILRENAATTNNRIEVLTTNHTLTGLKSSTEYNIKVIPVNHVGEGPSSRDVVIRTLSDTVPGPPQNPRLVVISTTSVLVRWERPVSGDGVITAYRITYGEEDNPAYSVVMTSVGHQRYLLTNLRPDTPYRVQISAMNKSGFGPASSLRFISPEVRSDAV